jgi:hypothetical protein
MAAPQTLTNWYTAKTADKPNTNNGLLAQPATYKPATLANPTQWKVDNNQTVQGQIGGIIKKDSPLMQLAKTEGLQQSNARGLLNSSMAVGAAQDSVYRAATPIATQDADTYARAAGYNADTANQFARTNADIENQARSFGAQSINRANEFNATNAFNASESEKDRTFRSKEADKERTFEGYWKGQQQAFDKQQNEFNSNVKASLAQIENDANFNQQLQQTFGSLSNTFNDAITRVNLSPDLDQASKDYSIKQLYDSYKAQLSLLSAVGSVPDVSQLLVATTDGTTPVTTSTNPQGGPPPGVPLTEAMRTYYRGLGYNV